MNSHLDDNPDVDDNNFVQIEDSSDDDETNKKNSQETKNNEIDHKAKPTDTNNMGAILVRGGVCYEPPSKPAFVVAHPNPTSIHMLKHGIFEKELIAWTKQFLKADEDMIDIGAHCGTYALSCAPYCRNVYAFEAQRMTYYQLCGGIAINYYHNVYPHHVALGEESKDMQLYVTSNDGGGSTLNKTWTEKQQQSCLRTETCAMRTLDSFALFPQKTKGRVGFIKIDVEGHELQVLKGALQTIRDNKHPPILFEVWTTKWYEATKTSLFQFILQTLGYREIRQAPHADNMFLAVNK